MRFKLHLPSDPANKEFQLTPSEGVVLPHGRVRLLLEFVSYKVMVYKVSVVVDVDSVGEALLALPIAADVVVPEIEPDETIVDFEEAFIGHAYSRKLLVRNLEELPARFEVVAQDAASKAIGAYEVTPSRAESRTTWWWGSSFSSSHCHLALACVSAFAPMGAASAISAPVPTG